MDTDEPAFDAFLSACPSRGVLTTLASKWTTLVLCALRDESLRFGQLQRRIEGVTQKMLTQTLRILERDGLLTRSVHASIPPRVDYELTELGKSAVGQMDMLKSWAELHAPQFLAAREAFDARIQDS